MSKRKLGYSLEKHNKLGVALQAMREQLLKIADDLGKAYPKTTSHLAVRSAERIDKLRSELDDIVCREDPERKDAIRVYFRGSK
jgi:hypothetical protein